MATLTENKSWYRITRNEGNDEAEVLIYDDIGMWGITAKQFISDLRQVGAVKTLNVRLNSQGGDVIDGTAIYNSLRSHGAKVVVRIEGMALSAGSFIAMAGDEVRMARNAYMMIHNAWGGVMGDSEEMRSYADVLDKMNDNIAGMYETKTGKARDHWRSLMDAETWFTAEEAKEAGLVDETYDAGKSVAAFAKGRAFNSYNKIPAPLRAAWGASQKQAPEHQPCGEVAPVISTQEESAMADPTNAPAQTPAAPSATATQEKPIEREIRELNADAVAGYIREGHEQGLREGEANAQARFQKLLDACPGKPEIAAKAFQTGQSPESVKMAFDTAMEAVAAAEKRATEERLGLQKENARLHKLLGTGGHAGVSMQIAQAANEPIRGMTPKQQAEYEWDNRPAVRETAATKEIYVLAREAELSGTHRTFQREPVTVA